VPIHPRLRAILEPLMKSTRHYLFCARASSKFPDGDHHINIMRMNDRFKSLLKVLGLPVGRDVGYVNHSLRHFFETYAANNRIPQRAIDTWLGHRTDQSMAAVYYRLTDEESQKFMLEVPFGQVADGADLVVQSLTRWQRQSRSQRKRADSTGTPAANVGMEVLQ
jgi:integrase